MGPKGREQVVSLDAARRERAGGVALARVYLHQRTALLALLKRRTGSDDAAQDLLQDVWVRAAPMSQAPLPDNPEGYLQRIAANLALDWLRRRRFRSALTDASADAAEVAESAPSLERAVHARQAVTYLRRVIEELPRGQREAFLAYSGQGVTVGEAARRLGVAPKTVENQVARAMVTIRARMAEAGLWP